MRRTPKIPKYVVEVNPEKQGLKPTVHRSLVLQFSSRRSESRKTRIETGKPMALRVRTRGRRSESRKTRIETDE